MTVSEVCAAYDVPRDLIEKPAITAFMRARKRWFHGRFRQQAALATICVYPGHRWSKGWEDEGVVHRRCEHGCGTIKMVAFNDVWIVGK